MLDTCALLWLAGDPSKLSANAAAAINDPANSVHISRVSLWEVVLKHSAGKLPLPEAPRIWIPKQIEFFKLGTVNLSLEAIVRSGELARVHNDPFDRLIAAESLVEQMQMVSPDTPFDGLGVSRIW